MPAVDFFVNGDREQRDFAPSSAKVKRGQRPRGNANSPSNIEGVNATIAAATLPPPVEGQGMLNPAVPVIGSKVTVVGSKVTEMLKRKLQQRLMAEKAKKVKILLSDDDKEPALPNVNDSVAICNVTAHSDCKASVTGANGNSAMAVSRASSFVDMNAFNNPITCSSQHEFAKTLDANKNKVTKPKSSKSKKTQKAPAVWCSSATNSAFVNTAVKSMVIAGTSSVGTSGINPVNCNFNTRMEDIRRNCAAIMLGSTSVNPQQQSPSSITFANGCCQFHSKMCSPSATVNGVKRNINRPTGAFDDNCIKNKAINSCLMESEAKDANGELLGPVLRNSLMVDSHDHQNPVNDVRKNSLGIDMKIGILKEAVTVDGNVFKKLHTADISNKNPFKSEGANSGLIETSSLWPLLYGENSKQLDDYIHRIYCRDCQKSQEQFPVGEKSDGEIYQPKSIINAHLEPKKCQLLRRRDVDESFAYCPTNVHFEGVTELEQSTDVNNSQKILPLQSKDQRFLKVLQDQNDLWLQTASENGSNPESTANSPSVTLTPDRTTEKDTEPTATKAGIAGDQSAIVCDDSQSAKAKKMSVKSNPKPSNKVIKFHEYKGPPSTSRPACSIALTLPPVACSPPLKDDLFQKLQQRQLCLQMQLQLEFCNRQLMANLAGQGPCDLGSINQLHFNDPRGSLGSITDTACKEPAGQPSLAKVPFSPTRTPLLLQSASSLMTSPFKFLSNIGDLSQSLLPSVGMSLSLPVTAGSQCMASSLMSSCERPGIPVTSAMWRGDQPWSTRLVQSDLSKISMAVNKPGNEPSRTCASLNNMLIVSSGGCSNSVKSFREVNSVQSTTVAIASAMTSAPILCTGGKLFPNSVPSLASNSSKAKNPVSGCPSTTNRTATVVIPSRLEDVKVADLKAECRKRKLVVSGPKPNLIERLKPFEEDILKCLSINLQAAVLDDDSFNTESKQPAVVGDQASSASSLTSVDSSVNIQPFCPAHEEELNRGGMSAAENKPARVAILNVSSDLDCTEPDAFKTMNNPMFQVPLNFGSNSKLTMSDASVKPCASQNAPAQFSVSTVATDMYIPSPSKLSHHPISLCPELAQEKSSVKEQLCATKPLVSFALPSVSQWYRLPQPGSIPASNSSLSALPAPMFFPNSSLATAATPSASVASIQVPNYVINGTTRVAIPPSSSCMTTHPLGFGVQPQCPFVSPQPRFSQLTLEQSKTTNAVTSCGAQTSTASGIQDTVSAKNVHLLSSPSEPSYIWSACGRTDLEMPACLEPSAAAPPQILSPSDLLNWQQRQIQELQKQLHLSRLQLLETNRRVLEQREQFHTTTVPTSRALCTTSSASTVIKSALAVPDSSKTLEGKAVCSSNMGFEYDNTLPNIPKLSESACCDAMEELFEDFIVGISPMNGCIPLLDSDVTVDNTEEEEQEQAFGDSCDELLAEGMDGHKSEDVIRLTTGFLSPGYDATDHSMLEMCAMEVDIETGDTNPKESEGDLSPPTEPERLDNGSFCLQVPLKEPPKYDDVIKDKQKSSSISNSSVAIAADSVDDLLQMLMKHTDELGRSTNVTDCLSVSESNTSPPTFTSPMSHDLAIDDLTPQEMDAYPYSAGSNCSSSSGISTAPSACGDFLNDPLSSSAGISSSVFSEIPFQLPDWTDSEFLDLSFLGKLKLDQLDGGRPSSCKTPSTSSSFPAPPNQASMRAEGTATPSLMPSSNNYDPCLAGFGPAYAGDGLGLTDLLDARDSGLPLSEAVNLPRSFDILEDLFAMDGYDIFQDPCYSTSERSQDINNISKV